MRRLGKVWTDGISGPEPRPIPRGPPLPLGRLKCARQRPAARRASAATSHRPCRALAAFPIVAGSAMPDRWSTVPAMRSTARAPLLEVLKLGNRGIDVHQLAPALVGHHAACGRHKLNASVHQAGDEWTFLASRSNFAMSRDRAGNRLPGSRGRVGTLGDRRSRSETLE
jgi:hypothetical protein